MAEISQARKDYLVAFGKKWREMKLPLATVCRILQGSTGPEYIYCLVYGYQALMAEVGRAVLDRYLLPRDPAAPHRKRYDLSRLLVDIFVAGETAEISIQALKKLGFTDGEVSLALAEATKPSASDYLPVNRIPLIWQARLQAGKAR